MLKTKESYIDFIESELKCRTSLHYYAKKVWPYIEGKPFIDNWHVGAICEHLEAVKNREIRKLIINLPPRTTKTSLVMVIWQTWVWITEPQSQFLMVSNSDGMAKKGAVDALNILLSDFYRKRWQNVKLSRNQKEKRFFTNSSHGYRLSTTLRTIMMGRGGDFIVADDFNSPFESDTEQKYVLDFWKGTLFNRANDPKTSCWINLQQRTGSRDLTSYLLGENDWVHLFVPMEFDKERVCKTIILPSSSPHIWTDPRRKDGELLWPERYDEKATRIIKASIGSHIYAGQYQQSPRDEEGGLILRPWWKLWKEKYRPKLNYIIQSWDTAVKDKDTSDYAACTTWGLFSVDGITNIILLSAWRGRVNGPSLLKRAIRLNNNYLDTRDEPLEEDASYSPDIVVIEDKASGYRLVSDLIARGIPAHAFIPDSSGNKIARVNRASPYIECGFVWITTMPPDFTRLRPEAELVVDECALFPSGEHDDIVDTVTQAILYLKERGLLRHIEEIMYLKDDIEVENLPGHKKENDDFLRYLALKRKETEEKGAEYLKNPFEYITKERKSH